MRKIALLFVVLALILPAAEAAAYWYKYSGNPVLTTTSGKFDSNNVLQPRVIYEAGTWKMWYTGCNGTEQAIGYATSADTRSWTKQNSGNAVFTKGTSGKFDSSSVGWAWVLKDNSTYMMWYTGISDTGSQHIGYASSTDGIAWTRGNGGNPVINDEGSKCPSVIKVGVTYKMYYYLEDSPWNYYMAESSDGISWGEAQNVMSVSSPSKFDGDHLAACGVYYNALNSAPNGPYQMWYTGSTGPDVQRGGYAYSDDGLSWTKQYGTGTVESALDIGPATWDNTLVAPRCGINEDPGTGTPYYIYYDGYNSSTGWQIGIAYSSDGTCVDEWREYGER